MDTKLLTSQNIASISGPEKNLDWCRPFLYVLPLWRAAREGNTAFSFCRTSRAVSRDLAASGSCKRGEISGAVWKKVGRRTNSSGGFKSCVRQSFRITSQGGTPSTLFTRIGLKFARRRREFRPAPPFVSSGKVLRRLARRGAPASEHKVKAVVGSWFRGNVAWREAQVLSPGSQ